MTYSITIKRTLRALVIAINATILTAPIANAGTATLVNAGGENGCYYTHTTLDAAGDMTFHCTPQSATLKQQTKLFVGLHNADPTISTIYDGGCVYKEVLSLRGMLGGAAYTAVHCAVAPRCGIPIE